MESPKHTPRPTLDQETAEIFGRRVAIHLEQGNWEAAHTVVDSAVREASQQAAKDPLDELIVDAVSVRVGNQLAKERLVYVRDLAGVTRDQLLMLPNIGRTSRSTGRCR